MFIGKLTGCTTTACSQTPEKPTTRSMNLNVQPQTVPSDRFTPLTLRFSGSNPKADQALIKACQEQREGLFDAVRNTIRDGADPNVKSARGSRWAGATPLHIILGEAQFHDYPISPTVQFLLENSADSTIKNNLGDSALALSTSKHFMLSENTDRKQTAILLNEEQSAYEKIQEELRQALARTASMKNSEFLRTFLKLYKVTRSDDLSLPLTERLLNREKNYNRLKENLGNQIIPIIRDILLKETLYNKNAAITPENKKLYQDDIDQTINRYRLQNNWIDKESEILSRLRNIFS